MARWPGGTPERLQEAAIDLFTERGYERTTVAEIAKHAGLTERTFYNHFADKREVLFSGQDLFIAGYETRSAAHPPSSLPSTRSARSSLPTVTGSTSAGTRHSAAGTSLTHTLTCGNANGRNWRPSPLRSPAHCAHGVFSRPAATLTAAVSVTAYHCAAARWAGRSAARHVRAAPPRKL